MSVSVSIGERVKELRLEKKMTIKQLGEETGLSIGYLSQFERGLSAIAVDALGEVAKALDVSLATLFAGLDTQKDDPEELNPVVHGIELIPQAVGPQIYQSVLSHNQAGFSILPRIYTLMPFAEDAEIPELYAHKGEEFIYVLEGIVTVFLEDRKYILYPGDSILFDSNRKHNWMNRTSRNARILTVNTPNPFHENHEIDS